MKPDPGLLENIIASQGSSESRLALAEWFEKHGAAPRAELMRADQELRTRVNPARRRDLRKRVKELSAQHAKSWAAELPKPKGFTPYFSRGLLEEVKLSETALAEHGEEILASEPVSRIYLEMRDGKGLEKAARQPWFERIRWLKAVKEGDKVAQALAKATHAGRLHMLLLRGMSKKGLATLFGSESLSGLRVFSLTGSGSACRLCSWVMAGAYSEMGGSNWRSSSPPWAEVGALRRARWFRTGMTTIPVRHRSARRGDSEERKRTSHSAASRVASSQSWGRIMCVDSGNSR